METVLKVIDRENEELRRKTEKELKESEEWRMEREIRMQERREREDKERKEAYRKSLEDLPPLEHIVDDGQVPGTSGIRSHRQNSTVI